MNVNSLELLNQRKAALTAGVALLIATAASLFAYGVIHTQLISLNDIPATIIDIRASIALYRTEIFGWFVILLSDIVVAYALYVFLKPIDHNLSFLSMVIKIVYTALLGMAIMNLIYPAIILSGDKNFAALNATQLNSQISLYLNSFKNMWSFGLILFGFHLLLNGVLILKSAYIPKLIGLLLLLAAVSYSLIHFLYLLLPKLDKTTAVLEKAFSLPMFLGELSFCLWLLIRGGKSSKQDH